MLEGIRKVQGGAVADIPILHLRKRVKETRSEIVDAIVVYTFLLNVCILVLKACSKTGCHCINEIIDLNDLPDGYLSK